MEWIDSCVRKNISIEAWVEYPSNLRILLGNLNTSPSIQSILLSLSGKGAHISASFSIYELSVGSLINSGQVIN